MTDMFRVVYLLHATGVASIRNHYIGKTYLDRLNRRLQEHNGGYGSTHTGALVKLGAYWHVARTWHDPGDVLERKLKRRHNARSMCPICAGRLPEPSHITRPAGLYRPLDF